MRLIAGAPRACPAIAAGLALCIVLGFIGFLAALPMILVGCGGAPRATATPHGLTLVVPDGFHGIVRVTTDPHAPPARVVGERYELAVGRSGLVALPPLAPVEGWRGIDCRFAGGEAIPAGDRPGGEALAQGRIASWVLGRLELPGASAPAEAHDLLIGTEADRDRAKAAPGGYEPGDIRTLKRYNALPGIGTAALAIGDPASAAGCARELLALAEELRGPAYGDAIHDGNALLGLVALRADDVPQARERLLAAGGTPGSPRLATSGPDWSLAKALLERGERDVVVRYLDQCAAFWTSGGERLAEWKTAIAAGKVPDFGR